MLPGCASAPLPCPGDFRPQQVRHDLFLHWRVLGGAAGGRADGAPGGGPVGPLWVQIAIQAVSPGKLKIALTLRWAAVAAGCGLPDVCRWLDAECCGSSTLKTYSCPTPPPFLLLLLYRCCTVAQDWVLYLSPSQREASGVGALLAVEAAARDAGLPLTGAVRVLGAGCSEWRRHRLATRRG